MRTYLLVLILTLISFISRAQFHGGPGDGYASGTTTPKRMIFKAIDLNLLTDIVYCSCSKFKVTFNKYFTFYNTNIFTLELSDNAGGFSNPTVIGKLNGKNKGTITAAIPVNTIAGDKYKIRLVSSNPVFISPPIKIALIL